MGNFKKSKPTSASRLLNRNMNHQLHKQSNPPKRLFHYTKMFHLSEILEDGLLIQATAGVTGKERPAVWFTEMETPPPCCTPLPVSVYDVPAGRSGTSPLELLRPVRFEVKPIVASHDWGSFVKESGITKRMATALFRSAMEDGSHPEKWWVSFAPVAAADWLEISIWRNNTWVPIWQEGAAPESTKPGSLAA